MTKEVEKAKQDPEVPMSELLKHVYLDNDSRIIFFKNNRLHQRKTLRGISLPTRANKLIFVARDSFILLFPFFFFYNSNPNMGSFIMWWIFI